MQKEPKVYQESNKFVSDGIFLCKNREKYTVDENGIDLVDFFYQIFYLFYVYSRCGNYSKTEKHKHLLET